MAKRTKVKEFRPKNSVKTKFIRVLTDWHSVIVKGARGTEDIDREYLIAPNKRIYRRAMSWENPSLVIDSDVLPPEHHIRLMRIKNPKLERVVQKALRKRLRLQRTG